MIGPAVNFVNNLGTVLISTVGAIFYCFDRIKIGAISSFLLYARKFSGPISEYANIMGEIQSALAAAERVFRLLDIPSESDTDGAIALEEVQGKIVFDHVRFAYGSTPVLMIFRLRQKKNKPSRSSVLPERERLLLSI